MTIGEYFGDWSGTVDLKEASTIVKRLQASKEPVCPSIKNIFKAFTLCSKSSLRVVIIGPDPYNNYLNNKPVATGIAFANASATSEQDYSSSLKVLRESVINFSMPHNRVIFDPSLESWEEQGVLLLNTALSCVRGKPSSHLLLWRPFVTSFLHNLSMQTTAVVYVLMGNDAQSLESYIAPGNHIIKCRHPAYYARTHTPMPSDIWKEINNILIGINGYGIQWYKEINF